MRVCATLDHVILRGCEVIAIECRGADPSASTRLRMTWFVSGARVGMERFNPHGILGRLGCHPEAAKTAKDRGITSDHRLNAPILRRLRASG